MNRGTYKKPGVATLTVLVTALFLIGLPLAVEAVVTGTCSNCHTMHNSQDGTSVVGLASGETWVATDAQPSLLKGTCLGCHGMNTTNNIEVLPPGGGAGASYVPQVYTQGADLAGGNFAHILLLGDAKGHNVIELGQEEGVLVEPPGATHSPMVDRRQLTCAGNNGCHGMRNNEGPSDINAIRGAHHANSDTTDIADTVANSYRFLYWVRGFENNSDRQTTAWQNTSSTNHNEYFGSNTGPMDITAMDCEACHPDGQLTIVRPWNQTISGFCATCHGNFHDLQQMGTSGAFQRHPNDVLIPSGGEFDPYTTYDVRVPVARPTVYTVISDQVQIGTDAVMCLSCHSAHATENDDMLRWNYADIVTKDTTPDGCLLCHTDH